MKIIINILNFIFFPLIEVYWKVFMPKTFGSVCVISHDDRILMIKHSYGRKRWGVPGGGMKTGESPRDTAVREVREEVGIDLKGIIDIGSFVDYSEYHPDTVFCFAANVDDEKWESKSFEISEGGWFNINELPSSVGPVSSRAIELYKTKYQIKTARRQD